MEVPVCGCVWCSRVRKKSGACQRNTAPVCEGHPKTLVHTGSQGIIMTLGQELTTEVLLVLYMDDIHSWDLSQIIYCWWSFSQHRHTLM